MEIILLSFLVSPNKKNIEFYEKQKFTVQCQVYFFKHTQPQSEENTSTHTSYTQKHGTVISLFLLT